MLKHAWALINCGLLDHRESCLDKIYRKKDDIDEFYSNRHSQRSLAPQRSKKQSIYHSVGLPGVYVVTLAQENLLDSRQCGASRRSQYYVNSGDSFHVLKSLDLVIFS